MTNNKSEEFTTEQQQIACCGKVLSHPARVAILLLLAEKKEIKTSNISDFLPISRPTVSQHLKELKEAGIICGTIEGPRIHYCLNMSRLQEVKQSLNDFLSSLKSDFKCKCD